MNSSTNLSFGITLPFKQRCNLPDCQVATNRVYRVSMGEYNLTFHSNDHARIGIQRWMEKEKLGIKPGVPARPEDPADEYMSDNLEEIGGDE